MILSRSHSYKPTFKNSTSLTRKKTEQKPNKQTKKKNTNQKQRAESKIDSHYYESPASSVPLPRELCVNTKPQFESTSLDSYTTFLLKIKITGTILNLPTLYTYRLHLDDLWGFCLFFSIFYIFQNLFDFKL